MSSLGDETTIAAIIERCMTAIDERRASEAALREKISAENAAAHRRFWGDRVPTWVGILFLIVPAIASTGILYAKIDDAQARSIKNEQRLDRRDAEDSKEAVLLAGQLATIKADVAFIKERVK